MIERPVRVRSGALGLAVLMAAAVVPAGAQPPARPGPARTPAAAKDAHAAHGTPKGWKFTWPKGGDPAKGREVFEKLECYSCHEVKGQTFPPSSGDKVGPELSMMGSLHEPEYFAEAILNPGAVIEKGKGYQASDGSSRMPPFNDLMTVQELIDLVAFLRALKPPAGMPAGHRGQ